MSVHQKLAEVNMKLMTMKITKSGYNGHKHFKYYELEDIIAPVTKECYNEKLALEFAFADDVAVLKIVDWENPKDYIPFRVKLPEIVTPEKNPNNQIVQALGANISYLQRYLLKLAFPCLSDKDIIDCDDDETNDASSATTKEETSSQKREVAELPMGKLVLEAKEKLVKKGVPEKEITYKALKKAVLQLQKWSPAERRCILDYFKEKEASK